MNLGGKTIPHIYAFH